MSTEQKEQRTEYKCPHCNKVKPSQEFYVIPSWCIKCKRADSKESGDEEKGEFLYFVQSLNDYKTFMLEDNLYIGSGYSPHRAKQQFKDVEQVTKKEYFETGAYRLKYANIKQFVNNRKERLFIEYFYINRDIPFFNKSENEDFSMISEGRQQELIDVIENELIEFKYKDIKPTIVDGELTFNIKELKMD